MSAYKSFTKTVTRTTGREVSNVSGQFTAELRALIQPGRVIRGSHIAKLKNAINSIRSHTHTYVDFSMRGEFGDGVNRSEASRAVTRTTNISAGVGAANVIDSDIEVGRRIISTHQRLLANSTNQLRTHTHIYSDFYQQDTL